MSAFEIADGSAIQPCDTSNRVVGAAAWSGFLRAILDNVLRGTYEPFSRRRDADHVSARGGEMPSGHEDMDLCTDKVLSKGRILQELTRAVKLVSDRSPSETRPTKTVFPVYTPVATAAYRRTRRTSPAAGIVQRQSLAQLSLLSSMDISPTPKMLDMSYKSKCLGRYVIDKENGTGACCNLSGFDLGCL